MIPLVRKFFHDLLWSPDKAVLWIRGVLTWVAAAAGQVVAYPPEVVAAWGVKDWSIRFAVAAVAGGAVMLRAGDKNPPPPPPVAP